MTTIEELTPEHFGLVAEWLSQPETNRWLTTEWRGRDVNSATVAILLRNKRNRLFLVRFDACPCGLVGFADIDRGDRTAMIWYLLGDKSFSKRGITSTAVRQLARTLFEEGELASIYAWAMEDNVASKGVLTRAGFREAGRIRQAAASGGKQVARVYFDMVREDLGRLGNSSRL